MLSKRFCFRKAQPMTSGILYPCRIVSQFRRPTGFGGRCATRVMNIMNRAQYHRVLKELPLQGRILDIGFGNGNMLKRVLKKGCCSVYGTEISESCMTAVEWKLLPSLQQGYLKLAMGSAESLPFADELCLPLCKVGGYFITLKGSQGEQELKECQQAIKKLGGKVEKIEKFTLPDHDDQRVNIYIHKTSSTPKGYPRMFAKIKKSPLK